MSENNDLGGPADLSRCASQPEALIPSAGARDAILMEIAGWCDEMDVLELPGILSRRKRVREDAQLRVETSRRVRGRMADLIRARMQNKDGDPVDFIEDVKAGRFDKHYTGHTIREAIALADKGLLRVCAITQIAGPWNNVVGSNTEYRITLTDKGEAFLAQAIEARRTETQSGSVHESAVGAADAPEGSQP